MSGITDLFRRKSKAEKSDSKETQQKRILVVDDDELVLSSLKILFKRNKFEAVTAGNGFDALEALDAQSFGLVVCDIRMPGVTGLETIRAMRETCKIESNRTIPVIFITGYYEETLPEKTGELGPCESFFKPFDDSQLIDQVRDYLKS